ncbi:MAG: phenylalanine--tRNA ligase subunit beta [Rickettsiaceae bacterium]|nr:phenylalanine--tRNA ligase subunit beta [Rickettsiaceae bacterium]
MRFTLGSIQQFVADKLSLPEVTSGLINLGIEVEKIINRKDDLADFLVAEIIATEPHPNADSLKLCTVDNGKEKLQIVCGAKNARAGIKVVLAPIGTVIPNGNFAIKASKIRGVDSNGMLCSANELLISDEDEGIIELPNSSVNGQEALVALGLNDAAIEVSITPNRGDCISAMGLARDLAALYPDKIFQKPNIPTIEYSAQRPKIVANILAENHCSFFALCEIENIQNKHSPDWLKHFLANVGIKSISLVVDIANYIAHVFGQPLHVYDRDALEGGLSVSYPSEGEDFIGLDDKIYKLSATDLVVKDNNSAKALAGILGAKESSCNENTKNIVIEAAVFDKVAIARTGRRLKIDSHARYRFERSIDQEFALQALILAVSMLSEYAGGKVLQPTIIQSKQYFPKTIKLEFSFIDKKLGFKIAKELITEILTNLGFVFTEKKDDYLLLVIPSWRADINITEDIVEEIARVYGYNNIPNASLPPLNDRVEVKAMLSPKQRMLKDSRRIIASIGYHEILSWSFMDSKAVPLFSRLVEELYLDNPISQELNYMRPTILPNMLKIAEQNIARSQTDVSLFEIGPVFEYNNDKKQILESSHISGLRIGVKNEKNWQYKEQKYDFFDIKADIQNLFQELGFNLAQCQLDRQTPNYYHPSRSARLRLGSNVLGFIGQLHPKIGKFYDIKDNIFAFELNADNLPQPKLKYGKKSELKLSNYQEVDRDFAFIINKNQAVGDVIAAISKIDKKLITDIKLFDLYEGQAIMDGMKSMAFAVTLQSLEGTLSNETINEISDKIINFMKTNYGAILRDQKYV